MKIVGIIGPYISGGNRRLIDHNIANVQYTAIAIADHFGVNRLIGCFAPHTHTARFEKLAAAPESYYHALDDAIYDRSCDGFILLPDLDKSSGAKRDLERAKTHSKRIFILTDFEDAALQKLFGELEAWASTPNE